METINDDLTYLGNRYLPSEITNKIIILVTIDNIISLCQTCTWFNIFFNDNSSDFWKLKISIDFEEIPQNIDNVSWKEIYQYYGDIVGFGGNNLKQLGIDKPSTSTPMYVPIKSTKLKAKSVQCGDNYTTVINLNDNIYVFGKNEHGEFGLNDYENKSIPTQIPEIHAKSISCGKSHMAIIDLNDNIWVSGNNVRGQLGLYHDLDTKKILTLIPEIKVKSVSCGYFFTLFIDLSNNVLFCGRNSHDNIGSVLNCKGDVYIPTQITEIKAKNIFCRGNRIMMIDLENNVWVSGVNDSGQLGLGNCENVRTPIQIIGIKAKFISCGGNHTMIINLNNDIFVFGNNSKGQLGLGDYQKRTTPTQIPRMKAKFISCGNNHTIIIDMDYNVWAFGENECGQLGLGDYNDRNIPTQISGIKAKFVSCGNRHTVLILKSTT
jgi:alpha-tubulin suppressor-like RCC1 family protein